MFLYSPTYNKEHKIILDNFEEEKRSVFFWYSTYFEDVL